MVRDRKDDKDKPISSGIYLYNLDIDGKSKSIKKCILLKQIGD